MAVDRPDSPLRAGKKGGSWRLCGSPARALEPLALLPARASSGVGRDGTRACRGAGSEDASGRNSGPATTKAARGCLYLGAAGVRAPRPVTPGTRACLFSALSSSASVAHRPPDTHAAGDGAAESQAPARSRPALRLLPRAVGRYRCGRRLVERLIWSWAVEKGEVDMLPVQQRPSGEPRPSPGPLSMS